MSRSIITAIFVILIMHSLPLANILQLPQRGNPDWLLGLKAITSLVPRFICNSHDKRYGTNNTRFDRSSYKYIFFIKYFIFTFLSLCGLFWVILQQIPSSSFIATFASLYHIVNCYTRPFRTKRQSSQTIFNFRYHIMTSHNDDFTISMWTTCTFTLWMLCPVINYVTVKF